MTITIANIQPILALIAGILILIVPRLLNYRRDLSDRHRLIGPRAFSADVAEPVTIVPVERPE